MWCTIKELQAINDWAGNRTQRYLSELLAKGRFPFPFRINISVKNHKRYEIQITDPIEIALLTTLRGKKPPQKPKPVTASSKNRLSVVLPKDMVPFTNAPLFRLAMENHLRSYLQTRYKETLPVDYTNIRLSVPDDIFNKIHLLAERDSLPPLKIFQAAVDHAILNIQNNANQLNQKGEKTHESSDTRLYSKAPSES